jgi:hypothetical protein
MDGTTEGRPVGVPYFHVVFTLLARIAAIAYQSQAIIYDLLFKASSQTMCTIAADRRRLGVRIGFTSVLHTWGSAMTHHPHLHMIVPGGDWRCRAPRTMPAACGTSPLRSVGSVRKPAWLQSGWLPPIQDRLDDVPCQQSEPQGAAPS